MITCSQCGQEKPDYNFFRYVNKYDKTFFVAGLPAKSDVCFECAGPYRCLSCGEVKDASHFRVMGRICNECKTTPPQKSISLELHTYKVGVKPHQQAQHPQNAENALESGKNQE